ncbi:MAG: hypothetical protein GY835_11720 [bacterium]|nr:hypothetical protein [bacterium]
MKRFGSCLVLIALSGFVAEGAAIRVSAQPADSEGFCHDFIISRFPLVASNKRFGKNLALDAKKATVRVQNHATAHGELLFCFATERSSIESISVLVEKDWDPRRTAEEIEKVLRARVGLNYKIQLKGRKIIIRKRRGGTRFSLGLGFWTAKGVAIQIRN